MATHFSVLAWRIPGTGGAWWAATCGVAQSRARLKRQQQQQQLMYRILHGQLYHERMKRQGLMATSIVDSTMK